MRHPALTQGEEQSPHQPDGQSQFTGYRGRSWFRSGGDYPGLITAPGQPSKLQRPGLKGQNPFQDT